MLGARMDKKVFLILILMIIPMVSGFGVTPGRNTIDFSQGMKQISFKIVNSENQDLNLEISVKGDLKDYVSFSEDIIRLNANEKEKIITYNVNLPSVLSPGLHSADIVVSQLDSGVEGGRASLGVIIAVTSQLYVHVPYPGKYVDAELNVFGTDEKKKFVVAIVNRGSENINNAKAEISIFDNGNNLIDKISTNSLGIVAQEKQELIASWDVKVEKGNYFAKAVIDYDGEQILVEGGFSVGDEVLDLKRIFVEDFRLGEIAKFNMIVENKWNEMISGAYAEMRVFDEEFKEIDSFKSATYDISPGVQTTMIYHWDTKGISTGLYDANVILYYSGKKTQQDLKLDVKQNSIDVIGLGYVISSGDSEGGSLVTLLFIIIGFLVLLNLLWFLILRKRFKKKK